MQPKVAVFVGNFTYPPTERFVNVIRKILPDNFEGCDAHVIAGDRREEAAMLEDMVGCVRYTMDRTEKLMRERPGSMLTASVVPLKIEFTDRSKRTRAQGMVFVAARNDRGNEWLYAHFVGKQTAPVEVAYLLAETVNQVLEERGSLENDPAEGDTRRAATFIDLLTEGVRFVLENGSHLATLHS